MSMGATILATRPCLVSRRDAFLNAAALARAGVSGVVPICVQSKRSSAAMASTRRGVGWIVYKLLRRIQMVLLATRLPKSYRRASGL